MVSFVCDTCQETLKKAKLDVHFARCRNARFSCIDCSKTFSGKEYQLHNTCITETQKYQKTDFVNGAKKHQHIQKDTRLIGSNILQEEKVSADNKKSYKAITLSIDLPEKIQKKTQDINTLYELIKTLKKNNQKRVSKKILKSLFIKTKGNSEIDFFTIN